MFEEQLNISAVAGADIFIDYEIEKTTSMRRSALQMLCPAN